LHRPEQLHERKQFFQQAIARGARVCSEIHFADHTEAFQKCHHAYRGLALDRFAAMDVTELAPGSGTGLIYRTRVGA
jgi:hypothetical protein